MSPWSKAAPFGFPSRTLLLGRLSRGCIAPKLSRGTLGFPGSSAGKESTYNAWDPSSISGLGKICCRGDRLPTPVFLGFPGGSTGKESAWNMGDLGLIPGLGRSPGEGNDYPLQYSVLENSMDCIVHGVTKSQTQLSNFRSLTHGTLREASWNLELRSCEAHLVGLCELSSWIRDWTWAPSSESTKSQTLDHQRIPSSCLYWFFVIHYFLGFLMLSPSSFSIKPLFFLTVCYSSFLLLVNQIALIQ